MLKSSIFDKISIGIPAGHRLLRTVSGVLGSSYEEFFEDTSRGRTTLHIRVQYTTGAQIDSRNDTQATDQ